MHRKTIRFMILILCLAFLFTGCKDKAEYGEINEVDIQKSVAQIDGSADTEEGEAEDDDFKNTKTALKYEFARHHIGTADISMPYPKGWTVKQTSNYNICFIAPQDDPYFPGENIWFHSTLDMDKAILNDLDAYYNHQIVRQNFSGKIQKDEFSVNGRVFSLLPSSDIDKTVANTEIVRPEYQYELSYRDWDANVTPSAKGIFHQSTTFLWRKIPCVLSGMTTNSRADQLNDLLLYMMSNSTYEIDYVASTVKTTMFEETAPVTMKRCPMFRESGGPLNKGVNLFSNVAQYSCPLDSGTGFSQIAVTFYEIKKDKWKTPTSEIFDTSLEEPFLGNVFGHDAYMSAEMVGTFGETSYEVSAGKKKAKEYEYEFDVEGLRGEGVYNGQNWHLLIYPFENGDYVDVMVVSYPEGAVAYAADTIDLMLATLKFAN